jgi:hypothetical protein
VLIRHFSSGGRGRGAAALFLIAVSAPLALAATALFPTPLHLVRQVEDPISGTSATIDEYCAGNRVVTVRGARVVITDYELQQILELNHAARTWSTTSFPDIARSRSELAARIGSSAIRRTAGLTALGKQGPAGVDTFVASEPHRRLVVGFDRRVVLSRAAAEVLMGTAYPEARGEEDDDILSAARTGGNRVSAMSAGQSDEGPYALLVERTLTVDEGGTQVVSKSRVIRIGSELAPAELMLIDPGAKQVESRLTRLARELRDAESLPSKTRR